MTPPMPVTIAPPAAPPSIAHPVRERNPAAAPRAVTMPTNSATERKSRSNWVGAKRYDKNHPIKAPTAAPSSIRRSRCQTRRVHTAEAPRAWMKLCRRDRLLSTLKYIVSRRMFGAN